MNGPRHPVAEGTAEPAQRAAQLLLARAKALAVEPVDGSGESDDTIEVLEFGLGEQTYAFELAYIREIASLAELCPLPGVPAFVVGITCMHGQMLALVDLRKVFGLAERGLRDSRQVIVLQGGGMEFGILGERVGGVRRLSLAGLQTSLPAPGDAAGTYLKGIAADGTVILCAARLLADPRLVVRHQP